MNKELIVVGIIIIFMWIINFFVSKAISQVKSGDVDYFKKVVFNGKKLLINMIGFAMVLLSIYWWNPLRWVVIVVFGLALAWESNTFIGSVVLMVSTKSNKKLSNIKRKNKNKSKNQNKNSEIRFMLLSNLLVMDTAILVIYLVVKYLF